MGQIKVKGSPTPLLASILLSPHIACSPLLSLPMGPLHFSPLSSTPFLSLRSSTSVPVSFPHAPRVLHHYFLYRTNNQSFHRKSAT